MKFKILFYSSASEIETKKLFLNIVPLYLRTYLKINLPEIVSKLDWLVPIQHLQTDEELLDLLDKEKPDLFCTSHYIWNNNYLLEQLSRLQHKLPKNMKILCGGPSINVNIDPDFFKKFPFFDFAIYGPGEAAFQHIIDFLVNGKKIIHFNVSNFAWFDKTQQKQIVADYKYVPQLQVSPYLDNSDLLAKMVNKELSNNNMVVIPYELTRGCPYKCSFCDWNSGLGNKTTRRKDTYKDEIDLFQKLGIRDLYLSDANVGQYDEDIALVEYIANKNINENAKFALDGNYSKLRKENNRKIYHLLAKGNLIDPYLGFTISVQDINLDVLKNIDRPDVGWDEHVKIIRELKECYPDRFCKIQLIQGLPGQTLQTWRETLGQVAKEDVFIQTFVNEFLPTSPAASKEYQEKYNFSYSNSDRVNSSQQVFRGNFAESCYSFSKKDFIEMTLLTTIYNALILLRSNLKMYNFFDIEFFVNKFLASQYYQNLKQNLSTNWDQNKFYFSINFDGSYKQSSGCLHLVTASHWVKNNEFKKFIIESKKDKVLFRKLMQIKIPLPWVVADIHQGAAI